MEGNQGMLGVEKDVPYSKTLLRYPGGKSKAVDVICEYLPEGLTEIVSPFFGGGSIELFLASKGVRVYGSDCFWPLVNFWQHMLEIPGEIRDRAMKYYKLDRDTYLKLDKGFFEIEDKAEQAAVFYILNRHSFSGLTLSGAMSSDPGLGSYNVIDRLKTFSSPHLSVDYLDFRDALYQREDVFVYLDPPYELGKGSTLYGSKGELHKNFSHEELREALGERSGWLMSYNDNEYIRELYKGYRIESVSWSYSMTKDKKSSEILILDY